MSLLKRCTMVLVLVAAVATSAGIGTKVAQALWLDTVYASHTDVEQIDQKFQLYMIDQEIRVVQERLWQIEKQWGEKFHVEHGRWHHDIDELLAYMSPMARKEYRELVVRLIELREDRKRLIERMKKRES